MSLNEIKVNAKVLSFSSRQNSHWASQELNQTHEGFNITGFIWKQVFNPMIYLCAHTKKTPHSTWPGSKLFIQKEYNIASKKKLQRVERNRYFTSFTSLNSAKNKWEWYVQKFQ